jgi:hypothetical protein
VSGFLYLILAVLIAIGGDKLTRMHAETDPYEVEA